MSRNLPTTSDASNRRIPLRSATYDLIMRLSVGNPLLTSEQIAAISGRSPTLVRAVMRSDQFLEDRANRIVEAYGDKIANVRNKILDAAGLCVDAIQSKILDPEAAVAPRDILEAAQFLMRFVLAEVPDPNKAQAPAQQGQTLNLFISPEDAARARHLQAQRAQTITIPAHPTNNPVLREPGE